MQFTASNLSEFFKYFLTSLQGAIATHVDDQLTIGTKSVKNYPAAAADTFDQKPGQLNDLNFASVKMETLKNRSHRTHKRFPKKRHQPLKRVAVSMNVAHESRSLYQSHIPSYT